MKKQLKPIDYCYVTQLRVLIDNYDRLEHFKTYVKDVGSLHLRAESFTTTIDLCDFFQSTELIDKLNGLQNMIECQLNSLGYTLDKEPKEIEVRDNYLKGG